MRASKRVPANLAGMVAACALAAASAGASATGPLHVPSPDWRDAVVYFALVDRFDDGDARNNDQGAGEFDPRDPRRFSGGDLAGITRRLDYIQGLGATAVWITPPVANQWWNPRAGYGGYHGYWASDFSAVDAHFGTKADYVALSRALHARGMHLVQDVVVNHVADWFAWEGEGDARRFVRRVDAQGRRAPLQPPFDANDFDDRAQRARGIYHWTGDIADFTDRTQELTHALAGLDDLDTANAEVRHALRASYGMWIRDVGVDAFRVDTAFHVPAAYFADFLHARDAAAPGIARVARETGREAFLAFGEGFGSDRPHDDAQARKLDAYIREPGGLPSMINFPLYGALGDVFARGAPTAVLGHRIGSMMAVHADPWRMPTFVDNHDVDRFLAGGDERGLRQALLAMLTLPGIPVIYYGTEQGLRERRAAMFASGHGSGGQDRFDAGAPLYGFLRDAIALRRTHRVFSRGTPTVLHASAAGPGAVAWRMQGDGATALVAINTASHPVLADALDTGLGAGGHLRGAFAIEGHAEALHADAQGRVSVVLPPRSARAWVADAGASHATPVAAPAPPTLDATASLHAGDFDMHGSSRPGARVQLVVDGDLARARTALAGADGRWRARVDTTDMLDPAVAHRVVAWADGAASAPAHVRVRRGWTHAGAVDDPRGDAHGPDGRYLPPTGFDARTLDITGLRASASGGALRLEVSMAALSTVWNPANGFDHLALTVFVELPGVPGGTTVMPLQQASLPDGLRWHRRLRLHGWSNALTADAGASAVHEGTPVAPGVRVEVDAARRRIVMTWSAAALGSPRTLAGARVHVTTWDYDGGYRAIAAQPAANVFGGGAPGAAKVMDAATLVLR